MSNISDFLKQLDEADYSRALKKEKQKKAVKKATEEPPKTENQLLQEEVAKLERRDKAKSMVTKPQTKTERLAEINKQIETQDKYNVLTGKGKPLSGQEAVDKYLDAYKKAFSKAYNKDNEPILPGSMEKTTTVKGRRSIELPFTDKVLPIPFAKKTFEFDNPNYSEMGAPGSALRYANERIKEERGNLDIAQKAKEKNITFQEAKKNKEIEEKYKENLKKFSIPGVDPKKAKYLARITTQKYFQGR